MATATQQHRGISLGTPLGDDDLLLASMTGQEQLSRLFDFQLELLSEDGEIDGNKLLGQNVTIRVELPDGGTRYFNGYVSEFSEFPGTMRFARYQMRLRPWLWFLTRTSDCRIFQNLTVLQVVEQVFRDHGLTDFKNETNGKYRTWEYCVQYRETDFNFVSRLLEHEGIYYFFEHENGKHTLMLADGYSSHRQTEGYAEIPYFPPAEHALRERDHIWEWTVRRSLQPGACALNSFNFMKPKQSLSVRRTVEREHGAATFEMYDYHPSYFESGDGESYVQTRIDEFSTQFEQMSGTGNARGLCSGALFSLTNFPRNQHNREYLILEVSHDIHSDAFESEGEGAELQYTCSLRAIDSDQVFRPQRVTPKPEIAGPQTAIIVGTSGEEIWTDKYGRVKVKFHWDRYSKADENSSCWIRVSQDWAGKNWGSMHLPRIGQEVIVDFLEGDPDRPIITGRVYNGDAMPPYTLPDEKTKSTVKSNSTKGGGGFNEIRFEDKTGEEQLFVHAQKNLDVRVLNDHLEFVGNDRHLIVKNDRFDQIENNLHVKIVGDHFEQVEGDQHLLYEADRFLKIEGASNHVAAKDENVEIKGDYNLKQSGNHNQKTAKNYSLDVAEDIHEKAGMNIASEAGMDVHIKGGMNVVVEAGISLTLKVGGNFVSINQGGVFITGSMVMINSGGAAGRGSGSKPTAPASADTPEEPKKPKEADTAKAGGISKIKADAGKKETIKLGSTKVRDYTNPQAQTLAKAAESGAPFCEECEKARQAKAAK